MRTKFNTLTVITRLAACAALLLAATARAEDKKADPTGTWTWSTPGRQGGADRTNTLHLKVEGEKLTGKLSSPGRGGGPAVETEIESGKVSGNEISFTITRTFNDTKFTSKYTGKLDGDTIKGKMSFDRNGEPQERDWEAKRATDKAGKM